MAFIDHLNMTVAPPQGYTVKHHGGVGNKSRTRAINKQRAGGGCNRLPQRDSPGLNSPSNTSEAKLAGRRTNAETPTESKSLQRYRANVRSVATNMGFILRRRLTWVRHTPRLKPPLFSVKNTGYISVWKRVAFSFFRLVPELISSPVQFLTRNIHSLIPILRHHPRPLLPPVPPLDSPVPHGAAMMGHTGPTAAGGGGAQAGKCVL